ncbi:hypothetical protein [Deminuibacter soli]|uniref:Uncharacterized protein n=1 Tax=Deminuibacter soli TaxID=2291815 RepID=A0A3E1NP32_9BACT|nr:hypothetical protein [Deminuibacter soli]RFM29680.1 hypothetical protein DXN05_01480 [Deminuibacter soli]
MRIYYQCETSGGEEDDVKRITLLEKTKRFLAIQLKSLEKEMNEEEGTIVITGHGTSHKIDVRNFTVELNQKITAILNGLDFTQVANS